MVMSCTITITLISGASPDACRHNLVSRFDYLSLIPLNNSYERACFSVS